MRASTQWLVPTAFMHIQKHTHTQTRCACTHTHSGMSVAATAGPLQQGGNFNCFTGE